MVASRVHRVAVLMGDLVKSRSARSTPLLHRVFNDAIEVFNREHRATIVSPLTITLGDEFQGLAQDLSAAFDLVHTMRLYFLERSIDCRFIVGRAVLETEVNPNRAWNMMGTGLSEARTLLNDKQDPSAYRFSLPAAPTTQAALNTLGYTMSYVEELWTDTQRDYFIKTFEKGEQTYADLAHRIGVSERNLYNVLRAGHRHLYERQIETIRATLTALDEKRGTP